MTPDDTTTFMWDQRKNNSNRGDTDGWFSYFRVPHVVKHSYNNVYCGVHMGIMWSTQASLMHSAICNIGFGSGKPDSVNVTL